MSLHTAKDIAWTLMTWGFIFLGIHWTFSNLFEGDWLMATLYGAVTVAMAWLQVSATLSPPRRGEAPDG